MKRNKHGKGKWLWLLAVCLLCAALAGCGLANALKGQLSDPAAEADTDEQTESEMETEAITFSIRSDSRDPKDILDQLARAGLIGSEGSYDPDEQITREQFIVLLAGAYGYDLSVIGPGIYMDVESDRWSYPYITAARDHGVLQDAEGAFYPEEVVRRDQALIWTVNGLGLYMDGEHPFSDIEDAETASAAAIAWGQGIISGSVGDAFRPADGLTIGEAADLVGKAAECKSGLHTVREDAANELILQEGVVVTKSTDGANRLVSTDEANKELTFGQADGSMKALKDGDILYMQPSDDFPEGFLAKVSQIRTEDDQVTFRCEEPQLAEVIKSVDISARIPISVENAADAAVTEEAVLKGEGLIPVTAIQESGTQEPETQEPFTAGLEFDGDVSDYESLTPDGLKWGLYGWASEYGTILYHTDNYDTKKGFYAGLEMYLNAIVDVKIEAANADIDLFSVYAGVDTTASVTAGYNESASTTQRLELPSCTVPISGPLFLKVDPYLTMNAEGKIQVEATAAVTGNMGFQCVVEDGESRDYTYNDNLVTLDFDAQASGKMEVGPEIGLGLTLCGTPFFDGMELVSGDVFTGFGINGETKVEQEVKADNESITYKGQQNTPGEDGNLHLCYICYEGQGYMVDRLSVGLGEDINDFLMDTIKKEVSYNFPDTVIPLFDWHYSVGDGYGPEFAYEKCPHIGYETTIHVVDKKTKKALPGVNVSISGKDALTTGNGGSAVTWLENGKYQAILTKEGYGPEPVTVTFTVYGKKQEMTCELEKIPDERGMAVASGLAEYDGTLYSIRSIPGMEQLQIQPGKYDNIANMAFYDGRLYYASKTAGTSDFSSAIFSCDPDGSDQQLLVDSYFNNDTMSFEGAQSCMYFVIWEDKLYFGDGGENCYDLLTGQTRASNEAEDGDVLALWNSYRPDFRYDSGDVYYMEDGTFYRSSEDGATALASVSSLARVEAVTEDAVYYSDSEGNNASLYRWDKETGNVSTVDSHPTAGSGGYFNF